MVTLILKFKVSRTQGSATINMISNKGFCSTLFSVLIFHFSESIPQYNILPSFNTINQGVFNSDTKFHSFSNSIEQKLEGNPCFHLRSIEPNVKFVFDSKVGKCFKVGSPEPCGENMILYARPDNPNFGFCDCTPNGPGVYNEFTDKCHFVYQQGFCPEGFWLQLNVDNSGSLQCRPNPCLTMRPEIDRMNDTVLYNGRCYRLGNQCVDKNQKFNNTPNSIAGKQIGFGFGTKYLEPVCEVPFLAGPLRTGQGHTLKCLPTTKWGKLKNNSHCQKSL